MPGYTDCITLEAVLAPANMRSAYDQVRANHGAPGIDGMTCEDLLPYLLSHPGELTSAIRNGTYRPKPVKQVTIPKAEKGKYRNLGIPMVIGRLVQQAVAQVLSLYLDHTFSASSCGFRPGVGAHEAIMKVIGACDDGYRYAVDVDLEKFFDTVNHSRLIRRLSAVIRDKRLISLIHLMLKSGTVTEQGLERTECGVMQGGPLSPFLANFYLDELDKNLERRGHRFVRYADDLIILCRTKRAAERTLNSLTGLIEKRMHLKINREKTSVSYITKKVKFLGYGFCFRKKRIIPAVHPKSKKRLEDSVRDILRRNRRNSIDRVKDELRQKLRGWNAYFKLASCGKWMQRTDEWIRRRIRQLLWKTWKRVKTRFRALRRLGCDENTAKRWAFTRKGYWHIANSHI